jgi:acetyltransferase-like isoleucine patch superfamily enzyme
MTHSADALSFPNARIGEGTIIEPNVQVGFRYHPDCGRATVGVKSIIRMGTIIYGDVTLGRCFQSGHYAVIRARVTAGDNFALGNHSMLEGLMEIGDGVRIMARVYIPTRTRIGNHVFIGPGCTFLNDKLPGRLPKMKTPIGPTVEDEVMIGGGCTILPGVRIGKQSFIAAGTVVSKDIPPHSLAIGNPVRIKPLPEDLDRPNHRAMMEAELDLWHPEGPRPSDVCWA